MRGTPSIKKETTHVTRSSRRYHRRRGRHRVVVITGAAGGIEIVLVDRFLANGDTVVSSPDGVRANSILCHSRSNHMRDCWNPFAALEARGARCVAAERHGVRTGTTLASVEDTGQWLRNAAARAPQARSCWTVAATWNSAPGMRTASSSLVEIGCPGSPAHDKINTGESSRAGASLAGRSEAPASTWRFRATVEQRPIKRERWRIIYRTMQ